MAILVTEIPPNDNINSFDRRGLLRNSRWYKLKATTNETVGQDGRAILHCQRPRVRHLRISCGLPS